MENDDYNDKEMPSSQKYRPPKLARTSMELDKQVKKYNEGDHDGNSDDDHKESAKANRSERQEKRRVLRSSLVKELASEINGLPQEDFDGRNAQVSG